MQVAWVYSPSSLAYGERGVPWTHFEWEPSEYWIRLPGVLAAAFRRILHVNLAQIRTESW